MMQTSFSGGTEGDISDINGREYAPQYVGGNVLPGRGCVHDRDRQAYVEKRQTGADDGL